MKLLMSPPIIPVRACMGSLDLLVSDAWSCAFCARAGR